MAGCLLLGALGGALGFRAARPARGVVRLDLGCAACDSRCTPSARHDDRRARKTRGAPGTARPPASVICDARSEHDGGGRNARGPGVWILGRQPCHQAAVPATMGSPQRNVVSVPVGRVSPPLTMCPFNPRWSRSVPWTTAGSLSARRDRPRPHQQLGHGRVPGKIDLAGEGTISSPSSRFRGQRHPPPRHRLAQELVLQNRCSI
jgi:hypothetical protein